MKANLVEMDIHIRMKGHLNNNDIATFITDWEIGLESEENWLDVMERMGHYVGYPLLA